MQPKTYNIVDLAKWAPKIAYGMAVGVPRVPTVLDIPIQFSSSTVNAPPVVGSFENNTAQDTWIERVSYSLFQQNSFPGSPFQSTYFNQLKQSGNTGVGIRMDVYGAPKYAINDTFTDLGNLADVFAVTWPEGWLLHKQENVKISAILTQTPVSVPFNVNITFLGWQFNSKDLDDLSDQDCRTRLKLLGFEVPDLTVLLKR
jgi:hypothetical protein